MIFLSSSRPIASAWCRVAAAAPLAPDLDAITLMYDLMVEERAGHPLTVSVSLSKLYGPEKVSPSLCEEMTTGLLVAVL